MKISFVIPLFNEQDSLALLHEKIAKVMEAQRLDFEIIFVNDGSTDQSLSILMNLAESDPRIGIISFRRNFGKAAALDVGFREARGEIIITMDADLQDDPEEVPAMLAKLEEGFDLVSGWKKNRKDPIDKTLPSKLFNWTVSRMSGVKLKDFNCGFKAYRAEAIKGIDLYGEMHRYIPVFVHWRGYRVTQVAVKHHARKFGHSKYGASRLIKGFFDLMTVMLTTRYQTRPLHLFGFIGALMGGLGLFLLAYLTLLWFFGEPLSQRPLLFLGLLLVMVGIQFVSVGLLGEMINRTQVSQKKNYILSLYKGPGKPALEVRGSQTKAIDTSSGQEPTRSIVRPVDPTPSATDQEISSVNLPRTVPDSRPREKAPVPTSLAPDPKPAGLQPPAPQAAAPQASAPQAPAQTPPQQPAQQQPQPSQQQANEQATLNRMQNFNPNALKPAKPAPAQPKQAKNKEEVSGTEANETSDLPGLGGK